MGANYPGQETAIAELSNLSRDAKQFLCHHICNALMQVTLGIEVGMYDIAQDAARHIIEDLEMAGIRSGGGLPGDIENKQAIVRMAEHFREQQQDQKSMGVKE